MAAGQHADPAGRRHPRRVDLSSKAPRERSGWPREATALVGVLALALAVLSFLLGREVGRRDAPQAPSRNAGPTAPGERPASDAPPTLAPSDQDAEPLGDDLEDVAAEWESLAEEASTPAPRQPTGSSSDAEVARYLREVEAIEEGGKYWDDPQEMGVALLSQMQSGDASGFDELIQSQRDVRDRLAAVDVPAACAEHHRRTGELLGRAVGLLEDLRDAAMKGDASGMLSLPAQAQTLAQDAREVDAMAMTLRSEHGLTP